MYLLNTTVISRYILIFILSFLCPIINAESIMLKSVTMTLEPTTANMQRIDANGCVCCLVKVIVPGKNIVFEGNLVGDSEYKTSEYWCYLSPNTRYLKIKYPDLEPLMVRQTYHLSSLKTHLFDQSYHYRFAMMDSFSVPIDYDHPFPKMAHCAHY